MEKIGDKIRNQRKTSNSGRLPTIEQGKLPPQAVDLEEAVLGAIMVDKESIDDVIKILTPQSFYKEEHNKIFAAIEELYNNNNPIDILTVTQQLKKTGELELVGGPYYVTVLTNRVSSSANAEFHARIIAQKFIARELIRISGQIYNEAFEDTSDVFNLLEKADLGLNLITKGIITGSDLIPTISLTEKSIARYNERKAAKKENRIIGTDTGLVELNKLTGGWQDTDLIIIAARPSIGKTAYALFSAIQSNKNGLIFSLEMSADQLIDRMMVTASDVSASKFRDGGLDEHDEGRLNAGKKMLDRRGIYIDDTPAITIRQIRAKARLAKKNHNIDWIILDYLQLCHVDNNNSYQKNREQDLAQISGGLKALAKELKIPVIALCQLSRKCEDRPDKRPQLADLRESGAIEQDADVVLLLYRPEFYGLLDKYKNPIKGVGEVIVAKNRHGATTYKEQILFRHNTSLSNFWDKEKSGEAGRIPGSVSADETAPVSEGLFTEVVVEPGSSNDDDDNLPF